MTVYIAETFTAPLPQFIVNVPGRANLYALAAPGSNITLKWLDHNGMPSVPQTLSPGSKFKALGIDIFAFLLGGSGAAAIGISYPEEIEPELTYTGSTIETDVGQQADNSIDPRQIRSLSSSDLPNRSWALGLTDLPQSRPITRYSRQDVPVNAETDII